MSRFDLIVKKKLSAAQIAIALAATFDVDRSAITLLDDSPEPGLCSELELFCTRTIVGGQYRLRLSLDGRRTKHWHRPPSPAQLFAEHADTECLISNDAANPLSWLLVSPDWSLTPLFLNPEELDRNRYVHDDCNEWTLALGRSIEWNRSRERLGKYEEHYRSGLYTLDETIWAMFKVLAVSIDCPGLWLELSDWAQLALWDLLKSCVATTVMEEIRGESRWTIPPHLVELKHWLIAEKGYA